MGYHFENDESASEGVKRVAREEIDSAIDSLRSKHGRDRDEGIHEARKSIKKLRALLRLVRNELGDAYESDVSRLREVGRKLSEFRDAGALVTSFHDLRDRYKKKLGGRSLDSVG